MMLMGRHGYELRAASCARRAVRGELRARKTSYSSSVSFSRAQLEARSSKRAARSAQLEARGH